MRTLVAKRDAEHAEFRYVTARSDGRVCCAANDTRHFCDECHEVAVERAEPQGGRSAMNADDVPPPISFDEARKRLLERGAAARAAKRTKGWDSRYRALEIARAEMAARHAAEFGGVR